MKRAAVLLVWLSIVVLAIMALPSAVPKIAAAGRELSAEQPPSVSIASPTDDQLIQGSTYRIRWSAAGVDRVYIFASGLKTSLPEEERRFRLPVADTILPGDGTTDWTVPYVDAVHFLITIQGQNRDGEVVAQDSRLYTFRPATLRDRHADGIYVDLHDEEHQRLYVLEKDRLKKAYLTSGAPHNRIYPPNVHPNVEHEHAGVFRVLAKYPMWISKLYQNRIMPWSMQYLNGHFIHGTTAEFYPALGTAASHGCDRLEEQQARELYEMSPVGTRVEVIVK